jgi:hypothetical protein
MRRTGSETLATSKALSPPDTIGSGLGVFALEGLLLVHVLVRF